MTTPEIYRDDESGDFDVFVPQAVTGALIEFLRGEFPFFGVTIEADVEFEDEDEEEPAGTAGADEDEVEEGEDDEDQEDDEPMDAFSFPADIDPERLATLLEEFFSGR